MNPWPSISLPPDRFPLLITGIAGVAGYNAFYYFRQRYGDRVIGIRQADNWRLTGEGILDCDLEDQRGLARLFEDYRFGSVLNAAGSCALKACELDPELAWRVNVEGIQNLVQQVQRAQSRLVHLSIDLVYSGLRGGQHQVDHPPDPVTIYGQTMVAAEDEVLSGVPSAALLRISLPMGISFNGHAGAIDWIQARFQKHRPATLYYDEVRTPTYVDCLNPIFEATLAGSVSGLYHAGGPRPLSLYEIAQIVNRVGGYPPELLMGCYRLQAGNVPPRAGNVTMDSTRLYHDLGVPPADPWPWSDDWVPTDRQWHYRRDAEPGSPELLARILYRHPRRSQVPNPVSIEPAAN